MHVYCKGRITYIVVAKEYFQKRIRDEDLDSKYNIERIGFEWYCVRSL